MPEASEAMSSSRMAVMARPWRLRTRVNITTTHRAIIMYTVSRVASRGIFFSPWAPPVKERFSMRERMISPKPRVMMAR